MLKEVLKKETERKKMNPQRDCGIVLFDGTLERKERKKGKERERETEERRKVFISCPAYLAALCINLC